jgi:ppGpp synthetase/RelA/SpoT-type nucleotidyltranferase
MQDIGGCRAVVGTLAEVAALRQQYMRSKSRHVLLREDDYIVSPKPSGYRSLHLIFRFRSLGYAQYNYLLFEVQLRTAFQHAWATAV